jgi:hypothetical protein
MIKFNKHNVTNGTVKARVTYSAFKMVSTGEECVTIYAKDWMSGRVLGAIFDAEYENNSDMMTDYFEKGRVRILKGNPLYAAAYQRATSGAA